MIRLVRLRIRRSAGWEEYTLQVPEDAYVLDALEAAGAQDHSLLYRHACHHASCGSCGLRVNGRERLACVTPLNEVIRRGKPLRLEPLRNFPRMGDLLVDFSGFLAGLQAVDQPPIRSAEAVGDLETFFRLENCIECGLCLSACPVVGGDPRYLGPAALAAAGRVAAEPRQKDIPRLMALVDSEHGLWRCHAAFECTEVCPAGVDPAREIMALRSRLMRGSE